MKMISWLSVFLLLPGMSFAMKVSIFPLPIEFRYVENESKEYSVKSITPHAGAITFDYYQLGFEKSSWKSESGTPLVGFSEKFEELNTTHLFRMVEYNNHVSFYSGVGLGRYELQVTNTFNGVTTATDSGQIAYLSGLASAQVIYEFFHLACDFRLIMGKDMRPQPTPALNIRVGLIF